MADCDTEALFCLGIIICFSFMVNVSEICILLHQIYTSIKLFQGKLFDCTFYPLISRLILVVYTSLVSLVCIFSSFFLICFESSIVFERAILYSLYFIFGPIMTIACFFFILNYEDYGYTCNKSLERIYNPVVWVLCCFLCVIGIVITVMSCAKKLIIKLNCVSRSTIAMKFVSFMLCESQDEEWDNREEIEALREEQIRAQL